MKLEYKYIKEIDKNKLVELFSTVGWKTAEYPNRLYNAIKNSDLVISVWNNEKLVQKQGIGTNLMKKVCEHYKGFGRRILTTELDKEKYYEKFGFSIDEL